MKNLLRSVAAIFKPPFEGLAFVVVLYFVWAHMMYPHNDVVRGNLPDPDDYMYLNQVLDWIKGQSFFDNAQHRLDPPLGTAIHFSRLAQIPMAFGILFFELLGIQSRGAALLMALIEPLFLLGLCLVILRAMAVTIVAERWAGASAYISLFAIGLLFEFMPGHVDHHGLEIALTLASLVCILRLMDSNLDDKNAVKNAVAGGLILALSMTIALECLPWTLLFSAWLGGWALYKGGRSAILGAIFGASYMIGSIAGLLITRPPETYFVIDILTYSFVYVILSVCIALPFAVAALSSRAPLAVRSLLGLGVAALCSMSFLHFFPALLTGPYGAIDPQLVPILLSNVQEAKPILEGSGGGIHMRNLMLMGFMAIPTSLAFVIVTKGVFRWRWTLISMVLTAAVLMTIFYQYRFLGMACAVAVIPLTALLERGWIWVGLNLKGRTKVLAEIGLLIVVGPLPSVIIPALFDSRSFNVGMLLFPVDSGHTPCDMASLELVLRDPKRLGYRPHLIVSPMEIGPELLFRSNHSVLAAPYHMDVQGNVDAARILSTSFPDEAEHIVRRRGADLFVICRAVSSIYLAPKGQPPSLTELLFTGHAPSWLQQLDAKNVDNFILYRVMPHDKTSSSDDPVLSAPVANVSPSFGSAMSKQ